MTDEGCTLRMLRHLAIFCLIVWGLLFIIMRALHALGWIK